MSSAICITFDEADAISGEDWAAFCAEHAVTYSPQTVGRNVFYAGDVEVTFGDAQPAAEGPPGYAGSVTFSTYHLGAAMPDVATLARAFWLRFGGSVSADPELRRMFA